MNKNKIIITGGNGRFATILKKSESDLNFIKQGDLNIISTKTDFLGVNYYSRAVIRNEEIDEKNNLPRNVDMGPKTDFGWEIYPPGIYDLLMRLKKY